MTMSAETVNELQPWLIVQGAGQETSLALWQIEQSGAAALAFFTQCSLAEHYAQQHCNPPWQVRQLSGKPLIQVLVDSYRQGIGYAALNPSAAGAGQVFVLREVLKAAKSSLETNR